MVLTHLFGRLAVVHKGKTCGFDGQLMVVLVYQSASSHS